MSPVRLTKRSKYGATRITIDGHMFDSKAEAARYGELLMLVKAGEVRNLKLQPWFVLMAPVMENALENVNDGLVISVRQIGSYKADFSYERLDKTNLWGGTVWVPVVEDVKSPATRKTEAYRLRKRHVETQYQITITEIVR